MDPARDAFPVMHELRQELHGLADELQQVLHANSTFSKDTITLYSDKVRRDDGEIKVLWRVRCAVDYLKCPEGYNGQISTPPDAESIVETWQESDRRLEGPVGAGTAEQSHHGDQSDTGGSSTHPITFRTRDDLVRELQARQRLSRTRPSSKSQQRYPTVPLPYPPCIVALFELERVRLSQLDLGSHNRGRAIVVSRIGDLIRRPTRTLVAIVDEGGDGIFVELIGTGENFENSVITPGSKFAIKEPYVTSGRDVEWCIHVDHPADIVRLEDAAAKSVQEWKEHGNALFKGKHFSDAAAAYESGLKLSPNDHAITRDLHRNLARAYLSLGSWDRARLHAEKAIWSTSDLSVASLSIDAHHGVFPHDPDESKRKASDAKAYYRAAVAASHLGDYHSARLALQQMLKLAPEEKDGKAELLRVYRRLNEEQTGEYVFDAILSSSNSKELRVDVASYTRRTVVRSSEGRGHGLFAADDLDIGDLVLCEKAFSACFTAKPAADVLKTYEPHSGIFNSFSATLWTQTLEEITNNPSRAPSILRLGGAFTGLGTQEIVKDGARVIDAFQVHDIVKRNCFGLPLPPTPEVKNQNWGVYSLQSDAAIGRRHAALFCHTSLINHSCLPNVEKRFIGDIIIVRATRSINKGEEILLDYAPGMDRDKKERMDSFPRTWQFACDCRLCTAEGLEDLSANRRRRELSDKVYELGCEISANLSASNARHKEIVRLEKLIKDLRATYDHKVYAGLPQQAMTYGLTSLAVIRGTHPDY